MRILFLNPVGVLGGAERALVDLLACLRTLEPSASLHLLAGTDGPLLEEAQALGVDCRVLALPERLSALGDSGLRGQGARAAWSLARGLAPVPGLLAGYLRELRREVRALRPHVLHSNGIKTHLLSPATAGLPVARVWHIHDFLGERPLVRGALRALRPLAAVAIANSRAVGVDAREVLGSVPVKVVYNGVDVGRFSPGPGEGARLDGLAGNASGAGGHAAARVGGHLRALEGPRGVSPGRGPAGSRAACPARALLSGGRTALPNAGLAVLRGRAARTGGASGAERAVGLVPFQREPADVYRALDLFVHASTRREPFGLTIAEALACGRPALISRASGAAEQLTEGVDALTLPSGDVEALAAAMLRLVEDAGLRERLGLAARKTALLRFARERYPGRSATSRALPGAGGAA